MILYKQGNVIDFAENGDFQFLVHGCNCYNTFGSGLAKEIKFRYPVAYETDCYTKRGDRTKLGRYTLALAKNLEHQRFIIVNAYTQFDYGRDGKDRFEYDAFSKILSDLSGKYNTHDFGFPKIGAGLASGDWARIESLLLEFSKSIKGTTTVCTL